jgi:hypothetical protein
VFIFVVLLSVGLALLRGGRADRLADFPFRHVWLIFAAFGVQLLVHLPFFTRLAVIQGLAPYLYPVGYCLLLVAFALNWRAPGIVWLAGGTFSNLLVITANGGKMPVDGRALVALGCEAVRDHIADGGSLINTLTGPSTRLTWLSDVLVGTPPFPRPTLFSAGDILLAIGVFILVQKTMVASRQKVAA